MHVKNAGDIEICGGRGGTGAGFSPNCKGSLQISPVCPPIIVRVLSKFLPFAPPIIVRPPFVHTQLLLCDSSNQAACYDILCFQVFEVGGFISVPALGWSRCTDILMTRLYEAYQSFYVHQLMHK
jgi:hypothetical protein